MATTDWKQATDKLVSNVERKMISTLRSIRANFHTGNSFKTEYKDYLFHVVNDRLETTFSKFEKELSMEAHSSAGSSSRSGNEALGFPVKLEAKTEDCTSDEVAIDDSSDDEAVLQSASKQQAEVETEIDETENVVDDRPQSEPEPPQRAPDAAQTTSTNRQVANKSGTTVAKRFKCKHCDYSCRFACKLKAHMRVHTDERPFDCKRCSEKFKHSVDLKRHQLVHAKEHKFYCVGCVRVFKTNTEKIVHDKVCKRRRYQCDICKVYVTNHKCNLVKHMRVHTGERPFRCEICMKRFSQKHGLQRHLDTVHNRSTR